MDELPTAPHLLSLLEWVQYLVTAPSCFCMLFSSAAGVPVDWLRLACLMPFSVCWAPCHGPALLLRLLSSATVLAGVLSAGVPCTVRCAGRRMEWAERLQLGRDAVQAVREVHARGVLHNDLKPDNMLVDGRGRGLTLADVGLGLRLLDGAEAADAREGPTGGPAASFASFKELGIQAGVGEGSGGSELLQAETLGAPSPRLPHLEPLPPPLGATSRSRPSFLGTNVKSASLNRQQTQCILNMAGRAPELLLGNRPTAAADVWELACVLYFIFTGKTSPYVPSGVQLPEALLNELIAAGDLDIATLEGALATGAAEVGEHPLWWTPEHAMQELLGLVADMKEEPRIMRLAEEDAALLAEAEPILELGAEGSWRGRVPEALLQEKEQYSYYNTGRMADLLRFVRNVYEHPPEVGSDAWNSVKLASSSSGRSHRVCASAIPPSGAA
ncbi:hypothetical protein CYMTET_34165 [Cymbomonas tetramitiformis]|uniref:Protein kinase domain-containing protein n=1 Tax=Cymbomonas tetramitiformis TaxID=36881 RepID=A0AAE0FBK8_9CHLO|nr:hypothetical protein CYMTET_34165 [Cymbomonas tetramitiformis]